MIIQRDQISSSDGKVKYDDRISQPYPSHSNSTKIPVVDDVNNEIKLLEYKMNRIVGYIPQWISIVERDTVYSTKIVGNREKNQE